MGAGGGLWFGRAGAFGADFLGFRPVVSMPDAGNFPVGTCCCRGDDADGAVFRHPAAHPSDRRAGWRAPTRTASAARTRKHRGPRSPVVRRRGAALPEASIVHSRRVDSATIKSCGQSFSMSKPRTSIPASRDTLEAGTTGTPAILRCGMRLNWSGSGPFLPVGTGCATRGSAENGGFAGLSPRATPPNPSSCAF